MKVGIITFHNAHNYGAILQLYALKTYVEQLGFEVHIINYINDNIEKEYPRFRKIKNKITHPRKWFEETKKILYSTVSYRFKWNRFRKFILNMQTMKEIRNIDELESLDMDYLICGSDQIWNPGITGGLDRAYFLNFKHDATKIAYAASMGIMSLEAEQEKKFVEYINQLDYISVREESLKKYVQSLSSKSVVRVLDPTLLIEPEDYTKIAKEPKIKNYLLVYSIVPNEKLDKIARKIANMLNIRLVEIKYEKQIMNDKRKQVAYAGPKEFIGLIKNASFVVTNSFHGTIFSMLFRKKFYTISSGNVVEKVKSRIENLLEISNLKNRCIDEESQINIDEEIDYKMVFSNIEKEKKDSQEFLRNILQ